jgi:hypothetical protein
MTNRWWLITPGTTFDAVFRAGHYPVDFTDAGENNGRARLQACDALRRV